MSGNDLGTKPLCQVGLIVRDIDRSVEQYRKVFGVEPSRIITTDPVEQAHTRHRGKPTEARAKLAFFEMGQVSIELIQPFGGPSTWQEFLDEKGEGVHHIAFQTGDSEAAATHLEGLGHEVVQRGDYTGGCYTYIDTVPAIGVILELLENR